MSAAPKPGVDRSDTAAVATVNGPDVASRLALVGFGPRSKPTASTGAMPATLATRAINAATRAATIPVLCFIRLSPWFAAGCGRRSALVR